MTDNEIIQRLRNSNIFTSPISPLPFENSEPDFAALNKDVSDRIENIFRFKFANPTIPVAGLILGSAGSGKTHMLSRILKRVKHLAHKTLFVSVGAFLNPETAKQDMWSDFIVSLGNSIDKEGNTLQFDILIRRLCKALYNSNHRTLGLEEKIRSEIKSIDRRFVSALTRYFSAKIDEKRQILEWFRAGLDDKDSLSLALPPKDVGSMSSYECENEAAKFLKSLGLILKYSGVTIVACFDELDGIMIDQEIVNSWCSAVSYLINNVFGVIPLIFARSDSWDLLSKHLDTSTLERIEANTMKLSGCSLEQAKSLLFSRIENYFTKQEAPELLRVVLERMGDTLKNGSSPRNVIQLANRAIWKVEPGDINLPDTPLTPLTIDEQIEKKFQEKCSEILKNPRNFPPDENKIASAVETWLNVQDDITAQNMKTKNQKLSAVYKNTQKIDIVITVSKFAPYIIKLIESDIKSMRKTGKLCCFISESMIIKPSYKKTLEKLHDFEKAGGFKILLASKTRVQFYALSELVKDIKNKDVILELESETKTASLSDLKLFLRNLELIPNLLNYIKTPLSNNSNDNNIVSEILKMCKDSPMNLISGKIAVDNLSKRNVKIDSAKLREILEKNPDFSIMGNKDDYQIGLSAKNVISQA